MCQLFDGRSDAEVEAAEALLTLRGFWARVQRNVVSTASIPIASATVTTVKSAIITSTPQPGKGPHHESFDENPVKQSMILSVDQNENAASAPAKIVSTPKVVKITSPIPKLPSKSKSGRIVKRTKRFISQSDEENQSPNPVRKVTPVKKIAQKSTAEKKLVDQKKAVEVKKPVEEKKPVKETKPVQEKKSIEKEQPKEEKKQTEKKQSIEEKSPEEIHPAKKIKLSTSVVEKMIKVSNSDALKGRFADIFSENVKSMIQSESIRHSRLSESLYELQHCKKLDTVVDFQFRAAENLNQYKLVVEEHRNNALSNRSPQMNKWMKKIRTLKNREKICTDFAARFKPTTSDKWKPFTEDAARLSDVSNYKLLQVMRKPLIKFLVDEFLHKNLSKEKVRSTLVGILKLLPNRPEVRHEFMNVYLPKMVAANKPANKKGNRNTMKKETEVNPAFQAYF